MKNTEQYKFETLSMSAIVSMLVLRIAGAWPWIGGAFLGTDAKVNPEFFTGPGLVSRIHSFFGVHGGLNENLREFFNTFVVQHSTFFGTLIMLGEVTAGVCLLFGIFTRLGGLAAVLHSIMNILAVGGAGPEGITANYMLLLVGILMIIYPAGRFFGVDAIIQRHSPNKLWRLLG